ncbi:MAG: hypothetical protein CMH23_10565 [Methylophaga sp.]|nr:hypothetical protein [Methylophaga sp.]
MFKKLRERRAEKKRQAAMRRRQHIVDRATLQDQAPFLWAAPEEPQYKTKRETSCDHGATVTTSSRHDSSYESGGYDGE